MQKRLSLVLMVIVFVAILIFAHNLGYLDTAAQRTKEVTAPVSLFFSQFSGKTSGFFSGILQLGKLQRENAELKDSLNKLQAQVAQLSEDKKEIDNLKALLGFTKSNKYQYVPAQVLVFDPSNVRGTLTIDRGAKDGLENGMAVISDGFLVGRIADVQDSTAKVQLITDPASAIPVTLQNANTNGIAKGEIGFGLTMEKIPQGEKINTGDVVITSGLGGELPKGLILGKVENVNTRDNVLFNTANVRASASMTSLSRLIIIKSQ